MPGRLRKAWEPAAVRQPAERNTMKKANRSTPKSLHRAGELRKELTPAEAKLWAYLRRLRKDGVHFRKQHAIGPYIADFCTPSRKLTIEVDGSHHLEQEDYDSERTVFLEAKGYSLLRFWNSDVMNKIQDVMGVILEELERQGQRNGD
jgi:very-short-patch-repair endonuclease